MLKKFVKFLPLSLLCFSGVAFTSGCSTHFSMNITYGTMISNQEEKPYYYRGTVFTNFDSVAQKIDSKESFILTVVGDPGCGCWREFAYVLNCLTTEKKIANYLIPATAVKDATDKRGFEYSLSEPILYFVNGSSNTKIKFNYYGGSNSIFVNYDSFISNLEKYCSYPKIYIVDEGYLDSNLKSQDKKIVYFFRQACGDCRDVLPNAIIPYIEKKYNIINNPIWAIDIQSIYKTPSYQPFKDKWLLSEKIDKVYGYGDGCVPTLQYRENGILKDMSVYFNDTLRKNDDKYFIDQTYYTETRHQHLHYIPTDFQMLEGKEIPENQVYSYQGIYYWHSDFARPYHVNFTNLFLQAYLK